MAKQTTNALAVARTSQKPRAPHIEAEFARDDRVLARPLPPTPLPPTPPQTDPASSYIARLAEGSRRAQTFAVEKIVKVCGGTDPKIFPWEQFRFEHSRAFLMRLEKEGLALATVNRHIAALRGVLKEAWRMGTISTDQYMRAIDPLTPRKGKRLPKGRQITAAELAALTRACEADIDAGNRDLTSQGRRRAFYGARDLAMFALLGFGLREHEVVKAQRADYVREDDGATLKVIGKGNKEREVPINESAALKIDAWLKAHPGGNTIIVGIDGRPVTPPALTVMLQKRVREAGQAITAPIASHDFRRTFISNMLDAGVDIAIVQAIVGHADTSTTARYDRRGMKTKHAAVKKVKWL